MRINQILKVKKDRTVFTIEPGATVTQAAATLSERRIGTLVVSEDGTTPLGILSERDIVRELGKRGTGCMKDRVEELMTSNLVTCTPMDEIVEVLQKMTDGRFRHMPVLDDDELVGLVSLGDLVKSRLAQLAMENDALEGMIMGH